MFNQGDNQLVFVRDRGFNEFVSWHGSYNPKEPNDNSILIKNKSGNVVMKIRVNGWVMHVIRSIFIKGRIEDGKQPRAIDLACFRLSKRSSKILISGHSYGHKVVISLHRIESFITVLIDDGVESIEKVFDSKNFIGANAGDYIERTMLNWHETGKTQWYLNMMNNKFGSRALEEAL